MAKITKPYQINLVKEFIPGFDFNKERTPKEIASILGIVDKKRKQKFDNERYTEVIAAGFTPGCFVRNDDGEEGILSSITKDGYLRIKGVQGSFNHTFWRVIKAA